MTEISAEILAFPLAKRKRLVRAQARWFVQQCGEAAEHNLRWQVRRQRDALIGKGVPVEAADVEARTLEDAVRADVVRLMLTRELVG